MKVYPEIKEYLSLVKIGIKNIVLSTELLADLLTPVSAYLSVSEEGNYNFLLESVESGLPFARYSFIGISPRKIFKSYGNKISIKENDTELIVRGNPWTVLEGLVCEEKIDLVNEKISPFLGGAVGYIGYEAVGFIEERLAPIMKNRTDLEVPDFYFLFTDTLIIFDNFKRKVIITTILRTGDKDPRNVYEEGLEKIKKIKDKLQKGVMLPSTERSNKKSATQFESNFKKESFKRVVKKCKDYIYEGDIFQVVLSQRFEKETSAEPFNIYRALRILNPSPYMFYFDTPELKLIGSSPEILVTVTGDRARLRPIAGTRPRGKTEQEDKKLEAELLADPKERAEHIMLVDLGRNDLGRVCNEVKVDDLMVIERYSHVMHIVSNVTAKIKKNKSMFDVLKASFPAGTVSGAPKIRAMEIISELEKCKR
ncbi:MAG: chorismate-binding protein, partial [Candidatus Hydrogenedentota bacterium]